MNFKAGFQIEIPRRANVCCHKGEALTYGMEYFSTLSDGESEDSLARKDYCLNCWEEIKQQPSKGFWKSLIPQKKEISDLPKQRDAKAMHLLKEILSANNPEMNAEAFVLALYLARRRIIYLRQDFKLKNGSPVLLYEIAETEEMLCIPKISLEGLEAESIQKKLAQKFQLP